MATFENYEDEEENQGGTMQLGAPIDSQQGAGGGGQGGAQKKGTGWTNLQSYIIANEGKDAEMGAKVKQGAGMKIEEAKGAAGTLGSKIQSDVDKNKIVDTGINKVLSDDPSKIDPDAFNKQYNATWQGAESAADFSDDYSKAASSFDQVGAKANLTDDFSGRQTLLKDAFNEPKYSAGEQRLDSFILGGGQGGKQAIEQIKQDAAGAKSSWEDLLKEFNDKLQTGKDITNQTAQQTKDAYQKAVDDWNAKVKAAETQTANLANQNLSAFQQLEQGLASNDAKQRAASYAKMGIDSATGDYLRSLGFDTRAMVEYANQKTLGDVLGSKDAQSYNDLLGLTGLQSSYNFDPSSASGSVFDIDNKLLGAGQGAYDLGTKLDAQAKAMKAQQLADYDKALQMFTPTMGINPQKNVDYLSQVTGLDKSLVSQAISLGIDPKSFIKKTGKDISRLDAATDSEVKNWNALLGQLGLGAQSKGGNRLWNADEDALRNAIAAATPPLESRNDVNPILKPVDKLSKSVGSVGAQAADTGKGLVSTTANQGKSIGQTSSGATKKGVGSAAKVAKNPRKEVPKIAKKAGGGVARGGRQLGGATSSAGKNIGGAAAGAAKQTGGAVSDAGKNVGSVLSGKKKLW